MAPEATLSESTAKTTTNTMIDPTALDDNADTQLFRSEALAHYTGGRRRQGDLLRLTPAWTRWSYWLLVAVLLLGLGGATVGTVDQYSSGPAVIKMEGDGATIVALLPGHLRPLLQPGMILRFTLDGYPQAYQSLTIDTIADQIVSPDGVRRKVGPALADLLPITAPAVLIQAHLPTPTFDNDEQSLAYYQGMQGTAAVQIRTERILFLLAPGLRGLSKGILEVTIQSSKITQITQIKSEEK